ncbi:protein mono-ADP-ribosyltransferase PARP12-like isoform X1 [Polyodon spathula]|uniref:protein mono-ADP-ribosyltransferase PARP12-like isoform X1 n=1 Tax=Polyodon spathula TaxID=7913 RepID=UPI001B7EF2CC|nr:protein mono-ADP-ribosyltransferase PARP12-like isoform X1 [Polyodon spathula]
MSEDNITFFTTREICSNGGSLQYKQLQNIFRRLNIPDKFFCEILKNCSRFVIVQGSEDKIPGCGVSPDSTVIAKTSVRLCKVYPKDCGDCEGLHLCKDFVQGICKKSRCGYSHDLRSGHNNQVLKANQLLGLEKAELFLLLTQNDPSLLPEFPVCAHYNKGSGEYGSCTFKTSCKKLHMCQHFLQGDCKFMSSCKRSHKITAHAEGILLRRGLSDDFIYQLPSIYINSNNINNCRASCREEAAQGVAESSTSANGDMDTKEICLFHLRNNCGFKDKCLRVHFHLPYKWEVLNGTTWTDLPDMEEIEKAFCNPANTTSTGSLAVDFLTMQCGSVSVRRLSTVSSVTKPTHFILTTEWAWYWRNEHGKWVEYGNQMSTLNASCISSEALEKAFLADGSGVLAFSVEQHQYIVNFKDMCQQNCKYQTQREVRRRPRFVSAQDMESKIKSESSGAKVTPRHWDQSALPAIGFQRVPLSPDKEEFRQVQGSFQRTLPSVTIEKIERIQNPSLWEVFQWQKEQMKMRSGGSSVDERFLFHGTDKAIVDTICDENFDWRICGVHGTLYGNGSYFARDAKYSHNYTGSSSSRTMFVTRVLVGDFVQGHPEYLRPPSRDGTTSSFYDSCVDSPHDPSIFVVFEKHQLYPEYLIQYRLGSNQSAQNQRAFITPAPKPQPPLPPPASKSQESQCTIL